MHKKVTDKLNLENFGRQVASSNDKRQLIFWKILKMFTHTISLLVLHDWTVVCSTKYSIDAVCLSVILAVSRITAKVMSRFNWNLVLWLGLSVGRKLHCTRQYCLAKLRLFTGGNTDDVVQWTDRLGTNCTRWIWCCLPSKLWTIWHCCLQET